MSTRVDGGTILILVSARAILSAGTVHMSISAKEGPAPGTWRYNLTDGPDHHAASGRIASITGHTDVLRHAAGICTAGTRHHRTRPAGTIRRQPRHTIDKLPAAPGLRAGPRTAG